MDNIPEFMFDQTTKTLLMSGGPYKYTKFKYKDVDVSPNGIKFSIEFEEYWFNGGQVRNAHETELQHFIDGPALDIVRCTIKAYNTIQQNT